jgi:hypothetical protein
MLSSAPIKDSPMPPAGNAVRWDQLPNAFAWRQAGHTVSPDIPPRQSRNDKRCHVAMPRSIKHRSGSRYFS